MQRPIPGWSFSGSGAPLANRGGAVGAWLADLLLYLFGLSAWWWVIGGIVLVVAGYRRVVRPDDATDHPLGLGALGFALVLGRQRIPGSDPDVEAAGIPAAGAGRSAR